MRQSKGIYRHPTFLSDYNYKVDWITTTKKELEIKDKVITTLLSPLKNEKVNTLLLSGGHGVGKTFFSLQAASIAKEFFSCEGRDYHYCRVNCHSNNTYHRIFREIARELGFGDVWSSEQTLAKLREKIAGEEHFNVILDEAEMVVPGGRNKKTIDHVLADLYELNLEEGGSIVLTCISNDLDFSERLSTKTLNKYNPIYIVVDPPNMKTLDDILRYRMERAFINPQIMQDESYELVKAYTAREGYNVKYALNLISKAADECMNSKSATITPEHVRKAREMMGSYSFDSIVWNQLNDQDRIVLYSIAYVVRHGSGYQKFSNLPASRVFTGEVYDVYCKACKKSDVDALSLRRFGDRLKKIGSLGLAHLSSSGEGIRGNTTVIELMVDCNEVIRVLGNSTSG